MFHARPVNLICERVTAIAVALARSRIFSADALALFHLFVVKHQRAIAPCSASSASLKRASVESL